MIGGEAGRVQISPAVDDGYGNPEPMRRLHPIVWLVAALLALLLATDILRSRRRADEIAPLRENLRALRAAADSCRMALTGEEARLDAFDARLDSIRRRVRELESLDPRGVPADSYQTYLSAFDAYNDSVATWSGRADTLRSRWERCLAITEEHNELADSVRALLIRQLEEAESRR